MPSSWKKPEIGKAEQMRLLQKDRAILRRLAEQQAVIAELPVHSEKIQEWKRLNSNVPGRPMVWINELPWHEMGFESELELETSDPFCQKVEMSLRRNLYQWKHLPADMVVEAKFHSPLVIHDTGFGINEISEKILSDQRSDIISRNYLPQIDSEADLEKIKTPIVTQDEAASERNFRFLMETFGDLLKVEKVGIVHYWFAPWDELIQWWGVKKALMDLVKRPNLIHQAMERLTNAYMIRLQQWRGLNLLSVTEGNYRVGSGGLGYSYELPQADFVPEKVRSGDQWGCAAAQIFSGISPKMHEEFALQYEMRWLEQFGLNYYGCCDALDNKIELLNTIPNLRKVSMSAWANVGKMVEKTNGNYVLSYKPNPAIFALDDWDLDSAQKNMQEVIRMTRGCTMEVIMKDISTVRYQPQRLWNWARRMMEIIYA
jgi:hypothetical protein